MKITTIGLGIWPRTCFRSTALTLQARLLSAERYGRGQVLSFFEKLKPCLVGMEACGTSHYWARELGSLGHEVKLMPPAYVKPYVKRGKTDAGDAEAICEGVTRPTMRFVAVKSADQQSVVMLHRTRELLVRQRTQLVNIIRGQLAEFGVTLAKGIQHALKFVRQLLDGGALDIPELGVKVVMVLAEHVRQLQIRIGELEKELKRWFRADRVAQGLATIPAIGFITASALSSAVTDPNQFTSARQFAAWLGLTPRANSSGGQAGCRCHGQQSRADRLGGHDPWRGLPRPSTVNPTGRCMMN